MARMIPELNAEQLRNLPSAAEARFYLACREQLPADVTIIYSVNWLYRDNRGRISEGEADFTLLSPAIGVIALEVKGGGVRFDPASGVWTSVDRNHVANLIKDPFKQASKERHALIDQITGHQSWRQFGAPRVTFGHAVMIPDIQDPTPLIGPDRPRQTVGVNANMRDLATWIEQVGRYWHEQINVPLGARGARVIEQILSQPIDVRPVLRAAVDQAEEQRLRLTANQAKVLRILGGRRRAIVAGGAGTGKTLLAVEKARQLAEQGLNTLLLCYNKPLADSLAAGLQAVQGLATMSFHQLCSRRMRDARQHGRDLMQEAVQAYPGNGDRHEFDVQYPYALALSSEVLEEKFDAIVVDEAQDFGDDYWFGLDTLLTAGNECHLFLFVDANQAIYPRRANLPIAEEPFNLTVNCRNTVAIHDAAYRFYRGEIVDQPDLHGPAVIWSSDETWQAQADAVARRVHQWVAVEGLRASEVTVLLAKRPKEHCFRLLEERSGAAGVQWVDGVHSRPDVVLVETVGRFKGLEAQAVILWVGDEVVDAEQWETIYVGTTRAKSLLAVVGSAAALRAIRDRVVAN